MLEEHLHVRISIMYNIQYTTHCTEMGLQGHHSVHHPLHRDGLTRAPFSTPPIAQRWAYKGTVQYTTHCTEMGLQGNHLVHHPLHRDGLTRAPFSTPPIAQRWAYKGTIQYNTHCTGTIHQCVHHMAFLSAKILSLPTALVDIRH